MPEPPPPAGSPPKLLDRVRHACRVRHDSIRTEDAYHDWCRRFILFHGTRHPSEMGAAEITQFLTHLAVDRNVSAYTQNQAFSALLFLYKAVLEADPGTIAGVVRANRPKRLPVVLTRPEVRRVLNPLADPYRLIGELLYGSGLRLLEALRLRVKDLDLDRHEITVREGKGSHGCGVGPANDVADERGAAADRPPGGGAPAARRGPGAGVRERLPAGRPGPEVTERGAGVLVAVRVPVG